MQQEHFMCNF